MSLSHSIHLSSQVIVISKGVTNAGLERKRAHDYSFQADGLAIDPRVSIVKFNVVNAFLREDYGLQEIFLYFFKANRFERDRFRAVESTCIHDAKIDIQFFQADPEEENGVVIDALKVSRCSLSAFYLDLFSEIVPIEWSQTL